MAHTIDLRNDIAITGVVACPWWCTTDHDDAELRRYWAELGLATQHAAAGPSASLDERRSPVGGRIDRAAQGGWQLTLHQDVVAADTVNTATVDLFVYDSRFERRVSLCLAAAEARSLAAALLWAADRLELGAS